MQAEVAELDGENVAWVVLTVAHLDHDLQNNDGMDAGGPAPPVEDANLRALCQRCHNQHDAPMRAGRRARRRDARRGQGRMF